MEHVRVLRARLTLERRPWYEATRHYSKAVGVAIFLAFVLAVLSLGVGIGISRGRDLEKKETAQSEIRAAQYAQDLADCRDGVGAIGKRR